MDATTRTGTGALPVNMKLPPCPAMLHEVVELARRPNTDLEKIATAIKRDAAMTAALLRLANSPLNGVRGQITSVSQALSILGLKTTLNLLNNIALSQSMGSDSQRFAKFWERSSLCAATAAQMARKIRNMKPSFELSPDDAYLAALFHDCGIPVLMQHFPDYRETVMARSHQGQFIHKIEDKYFQTTHAIVGDLMARSWFLPPQICQVILHHHDMTIFPYPGDRVSKETCQLIGIVQMADMLVDEHLCQKNHEWETAEPLVLGCLGLTTPEFLELKEDLLCFLNGD